jgi:hypothetical protein
MSLSDKPDERLKGIYNKLMKSDYEQSYTKSFVPSQKNRQPNILTTQAEHFVLRPQKCFNSYDLGKGPAKIMSHSNQGTTG